MWKAALAIWSLIILALVFLLLKEHDEANASMRRQHQSLCAAYEVWAERNRPNTIPQLASACQPI